MKIIHEDHSLSCLLPNRSQTEMLFRLQNTSYKWLVGKLWLCCNFPGVKSPLFYSGVKILRSCNWFLVAKATLHLISLSQSVTEFLWRFLFKGFVFQGFQSLNFHNHLHSQLETLRLMNRFISLWVSVYSLRYVYPHSFVYFQLSISIWSFQQENEIVLRERVQTERRGVLIHFIVET